MFPLRYAGISTSTVFIPSYFHFISMPRADSLDQYHRRSCRLKDLSDRLCHSKTSATLPQLFLMNQRKGLIR